MVVARKSVECVGAAYGRRWAGPVVMELWSEIRVWGMVAGCEVLRKMMSMEGSGREVIGVSR